MTAMLDAFIKTALTHFFHVGADLDPICTTILKKRETQLSVKEHTQPQL